jgi:PPOX class probable F420-dependent enzyme
MTGHGGDLDRGALVAFVREHGDAVLSTLGPDGGPQAAYLALAATDDGDLVMDARAASRKVANLVRDARVAVVVGGSDGRTVQCEGVADVPSGEDRDRCAATYREAFPQFAGSLGDPGIVVVRVRVTWARYGDYRTSPPLVRELRP